MMYPETMHSRSTEPDPHAVLLRVDAAAIADGTGLFASPGSILLEIPCRGAGVPPVPKDLAPSAQPGRLCHKNTLPKVLAVGTPAEVDRHAAAGSSGLISVRRPRSVLMPGLVNAHTHLDLTHMGPRGFTPDEHGGGFFTWGAMIGRERLREDERIAESVRRGIALSLAGGTVAVGDIAGAVPREEGGGRVWASLAPWRELCASPLMGVSYLEFFAMGAGRQAGRTGIEESVRSAAAEEGAPGQVRIGLQPHAPYSVDRREYRWAAQWAGSLDLPLTTHLAEHAEERRFVAHGDGPATDFLRAIGKWDQTVLEEVGRGLTPVAHLDEVLGEAARPFLVAHVNDADDAAIQMLAKTGTSVAYCPRCSAYFGHERTFGPHRYRDMLAAGVNVCLGTDSVINLPAETVGPGAMQGRLSVLDEMRLLFGRDGVDPALLLRLGTINGARALGIDPDGFTFRAGRDLVGLVGVEVPEGQRRDLGGVMAAKTPPELLLGGNFCTLTEICP